MSILYDIVWAMFVRTVGKGGREKGCSGDAIPEKRRLGGSSGAPNPDRRWGDIEGMELFFRNQYRDGLLENEGARWFPLHDVSRFDAAHHRRRYYAWGKEEKAGT
jgi:hypothetical protein